jgi:hypothetical protein
MGMTWPQSLSPSASTFVIPAKAGIQGLSTLCRT